MNRPKLEDYKLKNEWEYSGKYVTDLEQYCDELEKEIKRLNSFIDDREVETTSMIEVYRRTLNKAEWSLQSLMGDKGIYIELGYEELYFPTFEELRKWIEE